MPELVEGGESVGRGPGRGRYACQIIYTRKAWVKLSVLPLHRIGSCGRTLGGLAKLRAVRRMWTWAQLDSRRHSRNLRAPIAVKTRPKGHTMLWMPPGTSVSMSSNPPTPRTFARRSNARQPDHAIVKFYQYRIAHGPTLVFQRLR